MKNILVCVSGLTPQIITETLFALNQVKGVHIDEIVVVTTAKGKGILTGKGPIGNPANKFYVKISDKIKEMAEVYGFEIPHFKESSIIVSREENIRQMDIRTDKDNVLFPNKLCEVICGLAQDTNSTLHCSVSGGRKTMSVFMGYALSLFGRNQDRLYHVLTTEENEKDSSFFYPKSKKQLKEVELSEIPFVRLRALLEKDESNVMIKKNYSEIVEFTQRQLANVDKDVIRIQVGTGKIFYRNRLSPTGHLQPAKLNFFLSFLDKLKKERSVPMFEIVRNDLSKIKNADSSISLINKEIRKAFGSEWLLSEEFQIKKLGSLKYELPPSLVSKRDKDSKKENPGYAKYGILADVNSQIIIDYD